MTQQTPVEPLPASDLFGGFAAGHERNCRQCAHYADIHGTLDLIFCEEREKNKHPNYALHCEFFIVKPNDQAHRQPEAAQPTQPNEKS
jgi:hypothetical protein